jgi:uncharacterized membrane protein
VVFVAWIGKVGKLPRNYFVGIRIPSTLRSDAAWAAGHRAGAPMMMLSGGLVAAMGVRLETIGEIGLEHEVWWWMIPTLVALLIATVQAHRAAKHEYVAGQRGH